MVLLQQFVKRGVRFRTISPCGVAVEKNINVIVFRKSKRKRRIVEEKRLPEEKIQASVKAEEIQKRKKSGRRKGRSFWLGEGKKKDREKT